MIKGSITRRTSSLGYVQAVSWPSLRTGRMSLRKPMCRKRWTLHASPMRRLCSALPHQSCQPNAVRSERQSLRRPDLGRRRQLGADSCGQLISVCRWRGFFWWGPAYVTEHSGCTRSPLWTWPRVEWPERWGTSRNNLEVCRRTGLLERNTRHHYASCSNRAQRPSTVQWPTLLVQ
jgi:hypothetical protein